MKVFKEEQRFTQLWLQLILLVTFMVIIVSVLKEFLASQQDENNAVLKLVIIIFSLLLVFGLIFFLKLKTRIDENGIQFQFIPFHLKRKQLLWSEIENAYVRTYNPISEYGGWGMKGGSFWRKGKGIAYNVKGNVGIQLELKTGKKILIGTQKKAEVERVLQTYLKNNTSNEN